MHARESFYYGNELEAMSSASNYHRWIIDIFKPYLGSITAEVGAGFGDISALILEQPVKHLFAFEPASNMFSVLRTRFKDNLRITLKNNVLKTGANDYRNYFDSVVYINVLEHINDDQGELCATHNALRKGGHLLVFVPSLSWLYSNFDRDVGHIRRYEKKELIRLVQDSGFSIINIRYLDFPGIFAWYIVFVTLKKQMKTDGVSFYDRTLIPVIRRIESFIAPPIGKNLILIGQKK